ncbi:integrase [Shewanella sp. A3A]|nr:integrase [Shewanella ferrihydritica]
MAFMIQPIRNKRTDIFEVRLGVPKALIPYVKEKKKAFRRSLGTKDPQEAKAKGPAVINELYGILAEARLRKDNQERESSINPAVLDVIVSRWLINERQRIAEPEILSRYTLETDAGLESVPEWFSDPLLELTNASGDNQTVVEEKFLRHMEAFVDEALALSSCQLLTHKPRLYLAERIAREAIKLCNSAVDNQSLLRREAVRFGSLKTSIQSSQTIPQSLTEMGFTVIDSNVTSEANASSDDQISKNSTVSQLIEWVHSQKKIELGDDLGNWIAERNKACSRASEFFGNKLIGDIRKLDMRTLLELVTQCPSLPKMHIRSLPMKKQIEIANAENLARVSLQTANKEIKLLSGYFQLAVKLDLIPNNPCHGVSIAVPKKVKLRVPEYTNSDISAIFLLPLFREIPAKIKARYGDAPYWLPVILAYTGARAEEIAQLYVDDIEQDAEKPDEWYFHIRAAKPDQSVKRNKSRRVPIAQPLINLGFFEYLKTVPTEGRVFPLLKAASKGKYHATVARYLRGQFESCNIPHFDELEPLHAFRHRFTTEARKIDMREDVQNAITGHSNAGNVGRAYGSYQELHAAINKMPVINIPKWHP